MDEYRIKSVDELTFADDFMFGTIMREADICRDVLECLLGISISRVEYPKLQKAISPFYEAKGVRLDVFATDSKRVFDVEMQTARQDALGRRMRYYQSMIDIDSLQRGADYGELKDSFIIFICLHDPFKMGLPRYTFTSECKENSEADLQDGAIKVLFNATAYKAESNDKLRAFLQYLKTHEVTDALTERLSELVAKAKNDDNFRGDYMQYTLHERDIRRSSFAQGIAQGISQGISQGIARGISQEKQNSAVNFLLHKTPISLISECIGLSTEQVQQIADRLRAEGRLLE